MSNSLAIRADVAAGNARVDEAQLFLRQAIEKLGEAKQAYERIESDNANLRNAIAAVNGTTRELDEGLTISFGITSQADVYASRV